MTPEQKANELVDTFRVVLMSEDSDCGDEILCTTIAIQHAHRVADEVIVALENHIFESDPHSFSLDGLEFYRNVKQVLEKM